MLTTGSGSKKTDGIFLSKATILTAEDISGKQLQFMSAPVDLGIALTLDIGQSFNPTMHFMGNFRRDEVSKAVVDWGGATAVKMFLNQMFPGEEIPLTEDFHVPQDVLDRLIGKQFRRLSYISGVKPNGKTKYSDWNTIVSIEKSDEDLIALFHKSLAKGYPRNYKPDGGASEDDTSFPSASSSEPVF